MAQERSPRSIDPASDPEAWAALRRRSRRVAAVVAVALGAIAAVVLEVQRMGWPVSILVGLLVAVVVLAVAAWLIERTMYAEDPSSR